jgi:hypothetical protein
VGAPPLVETAAPPEHTIAWPVGRGMPGHTPAGTVVVVVGGVDVGGGGPLSARQSSRVCSSAPHARNCAPPELEHVGDIESMHCRKAEDADPQAGVIETSWVQLVTQSPVPEEHPAWAILAQAAEHPSMTWAGEQLSPQRAGGPPSSVVAPPHPSAPARTSARPTRAPPTTIPSAVMGPTWPRWPRSRGTVNRAARAPSPARDLCFRGAGPPQRRLPGGEAATGGATLVLRERVLLEARLPDGARVASGRTLRVACSLTPEVHRQGSRWRTVVKESSRWSRSGRSRRARS